jgi:hypothetical protein
MFFVFFIHPMIKKLIHIMIAIENVIEICEVVVKMNGNNDRKFLEKIKKNIDKRIIIELFFFESSIMEFNSIFILLISIFIKISIFDLFKIVFLNNSIGIMNIVQFKLSHDLEGSNIEKRLFIIFILYLYGI